MRERVEWIDSLRFLAILLVMITHFIALFEPSLFRYWKTGYSSIILYGVSGKLSVAFFSVLIGYFAAKKFENKNNDYAKYIVSRYCRFSTNLFVINLIVIIFMILFKSLKIQPNNLNINNIFLSQDIFDIKTLLSDSFFFNKNIVPTFWCIKDFFVGSLVVALISLQTLGKEKFRVIIYAIAMGISFLSGNIWVGICILGGVLNYVVNLKLNIFKNKFILIIIFIIAYKLIRNPESNITFIKDGIASFLFIIVCFNTKFIQNILNHSALNYLGKISFQFFLVHTPVHYIFTYIFIDIVCKSLSWEVSLLIGFILTLSLDILISKYMYLLCEEIIPNRVAKII